MIAAPAGEGRTSFVSRDDLADVGAAVLLDDSGRFDGRALDVTGPEALTLAEAAEVLTRGHRRPVDYRDQTVEEAWATRRPSGHPDWEIEGWVTSYLAIAAGELATVSDVVPTADRPSRDDRGRAPAPAPRGLGEPARLMPGVQASTPCAHRDVDTCTVAPERAATADPVVDDHAGEQDAAEVGSGVLVIAGGDGAPLLEAAEAAFDGVAVLVALGVEGRRSPTG